jgi:hypothetical protein
MGCEVDREKGDGEMTAKFIYIKGNTVYLLNGIPEGEVEPDLVHASYSAMHRANVAFDAANKPVGFRAHWALENVYQAG